MKYNLMYDPTSPNGLRGAREMMKLKLFQRKKRRGRPRKNEPFVSWFPRLSAVTFVFVMFAFLATDIPKLLGNSPLLFNFFFGILILSIIILTWRKNKIAGISFIILGFLYVLATWNSLLAVSSVSTSIWLIATGLLFIASDKRSAERKVETIAVASDHKTTR